MSHVLAAASAHARCGRDHQFWILGPSRSVAALA